MREELVRTAMLIGEPAMDKLAGARVAVFGIGGVGGYVCEALVRSGVGAFELIDKDKIDLSNINRQIIADHDTVGRFKAEVMKERMLKINPSVQVDVRNCFFLPENAEEFDFSRYSYVVDAVDTVTAKLEIVMRAKEKGIPVISAMGAGNKLDGSRFRAADIYETRVCPLARVMRRELKKRGIESLKVVYSDEEPMTPCAAVGLEEGYSGGKCLKDGAAADSVTISIHKTTDGRERDSVISGDSEREASHKRRSTPGSTAFVPSAAGLIIAGEVVKDLIKC